MEFWPKIALTVSICLSLVACGGGGDTKASSKAPVATQTQEGVLQEKAVHSFVLGESTSSLSQEQRDLLERTLSSFSRKFPKMISKVLANGFRKIDFEQEDSSEGGVNTLAAVFTEQKRIVIYENYFLNTLRIASGKTGMALSELSLLHELLHAFDADNSIVGVNYPLLGWERKENLPAGHSGFEVQTPSELKNVWITASQLSEIKTKATPLLNSGDRAGAFALARSLTLKYGYPTIYSVLGGPVETFAELGAYIALDSSAVKYVRPATFKWYQENILK